MNQFRCGCGRWCRLQSAGAFAVAVAVPAPSYTVKTGGLGLVALHMSLSETRSISTLTNCCKLNAEAAVCTWSGLLACAECQYKHSP